MRTAHQVVDRPTRHEFSQPPEWMEPFLATATSGKAIRISLDGRRMGTIRVNISQMAARRGLKGHAKKDGADHLIIWCEQWQGTFE